MKFAETQGKSLEEGSSWEKYQALVSLINSYIAPKWVDSNKRYYENREKQVYYFSMEFLIGKLLPHYQLRYKGHGTGWAASWASILKNWWKQKGCRSGRRQARQISCLFLDSMASLGIRA